MRNSGPWTYAVVNLSHLVGVAVLFGSVLMLDLRLLGAWRRLPLADFAATVPAVASSGFVLAAVSGVGLLATKATEYADNPFMLVKFPAIALALVNVAITARSTAWQAVGDAEMSHRNRRRLAQAGAWSLMSWFTAIAAGRLVGYW